MNRRIGETGRWRHALKAASSRRTPKRAARAKEYRLFADSPFRRFLPFLVCLLALSLAGAGFAQDEEQEDEKSNAKPDAGGIVIEPSSERIAGASANLSRFDLRRSPR